MRQPVDGKQPVKPGPAPELVSEHGKGQGTVKKPGVKRTPPIVAPKPTSKAPKPTLATRQKIVQFARWGIVNTAAIHYAETRPIPQVKPGVLPTLPLTADCSGFATMAYQYAGASDPNGLEYNGQGYTGTLLTHGRRVPLEHVRPADVAVFGCKSFPGGHHAAVVVAVEGDSFHDVVLASHGSENGPLEITVASEAGYQPDGLAGVVFLSFLP